MAAAGALFSFVTWLKPERVDTPLFRWLGLCGMAAGWASIGAAIRAEAGPAGGGNTFAMLVGMGLSSAPWAFFIAALIPSVLGRIATSAMSDGRLQLRPAYDKAEAAEARRDFAAAETLYRDIAAQRPDDPEPLRRLAELLVKRGDPRAAANAMQQAIRIEENPNEKFLLSIRLSEIFADDARDPASAAKVLSDLIAALPDNPGVRFAQERLKLLRQRMT